MLVTVTNSSREFGLNSSSRLCFRDRETNVNRASRLNWYYIYIYTLSVGEQPIHHVLTSFEIFKAV